MDFLNELDDLPVISRAKTFKKPIDEPNTKIQQSESNSSLNFKDFNIFKSSEQEQGTDEETDEEERKYIDKIPIESMDFKAIGALGSRLDLLQSVMKRLDKSRDGKPKTQTSENQEIATQPMPSQIETSESSTQPIVDAEQVSSIKETQVLVASSFTDTQQLPPTEEDQEIGSSTQQIASARISRTTQVIQSSDEEEEEKDKEMTTHKPTARIHNSALFVSDDESDADENLTTQKQIEDLFGDIDEEEDVTSALIENYKNMSREEKILARAQEKARARQEANKKKIADDAVGLEVQEKEVEPPRQKKHSRKNEKIQKMAEIIKHNELIKKAKHISEKRDVEKFAPNKLIDLFNKESDSEDEEDVFSNNSMVDTPGSSPKKSGITEEFKKPATPLQNKRQPIPIAGYQARLLQGSKDHVVLSDSDSDDDIEKLKSNTPKTTMFEIKHRFSKQKGLKTEMKTKTLKTILKEEKIKQSKEFMTQRKQNSKFSVEASKEDDEIVRLLQDEIDRNKKLKARDQEREARKAILLHAQTKTKAESDGDESEYSNYTGDDDEEDEQEEEEASDKEMEEDEDNNNSREADEPEISFDLGGRLQDTTGFKNMSLSDAFGQTLPQDKSMEGLEPAQVAIKLNARLNGKAEESFNDTTELSNHDTTSFFQNAVQVTDTTATDEALKFIEDDDEENAQADDEADEPTAFKKAILESQNFLPDTQVDGMSQDQFADVIRSTGYGDIAAEDEEEDDDEAIKPNRKKKILTKATQATEEYSDAPNEEEEEDEETRAARSRAMRESRKQDEERRRRKEAEFKKKGVNQMMENEAVESEDEWHGIGGNDGEGSDGENSDDERMLDDASNVMVDENEIRAELIKNDVQADDLMIKKIFKDLKTGAFRKRRAKEGAYELDLSDDEDNQIMKLYENRRIEYQRQQLLKNKDLKNLSKDEKSKAFYNTIVLDNKKSESFQFEEPIVSENDSEEDDHDDKDPFVSKRKINKIQEESDNEDEEEEVVIKPKKRKITREQVRSMISFLDEDNDRPDSINLDSDDDGFEEIREIKQNSRIKLSENPQPRRLLISKSTHKSINSKSVPDSVDCLATQQKAMDDDSDSDFDESLIDGGILASRARSITASFKTNGNKKFKMSVSGREYQEVNVTTSSKQVMNTRGAVTYLTNKSTVAIKSNKVSRIEEKLKSSRNNSLRGMFGSSGFQ
ncbi:hypothetical protein CANARDRAFT_29508 [[Candida] arabinofermentans NRRL YB-2248]|uniref:DNA replication checkpoint mediator MRC1 domain-containing protein n=1 Tax=[Candida] arabinofermentans NRRL YB-2248 TaxID=983967 RepID=A0A1E4SX23_9ASCO|nr:hypothetical protein CANARDRAFT_29508 [[Candida] arabinofermentans NRRL YB-2248]